MGAGYGGVLTEVGRKRRQGGVGCPVCDNDGFEPVRFERWVRCTTCRTVFVQRRSKQLAEVLNSAVGELTATRTRTGRKIRK